MSKIPPFINFSTNKPEHSIALIVEGYEECYYFNRLTELNIFSKKYDIQLFNAKSASNIASIYQSKLASNRFSVVFVVCDKDRVPTQYDLIVKEMKLILGEEGANETIFFTSPCTLQIILSHFGEVELITQAKPAARRIVKEFTGVENYDAHKQQLETICSKIFRRTFTEMLERISKLSTNSNDLPSTNMLLLFNYLCSDDTEWIKKIDKIINN